ncbi:MAG TPA: hypothetical protein VK601_20050 [Kofleriaceae bacterium]|nr:hypothetical protein [Kofleriaceae bacterium]
MILTAGACVGVDEPATAEHESAISQLIGEKFDPLNVGNIDGQNGWVGNCTVTDRVTSDRNASDKYMKCVGGNNATKNIGLHGAGSYTLLVDLGPNNNVVDATHGKFSLEGPQGRVFQIAVGCNNIRVAFQMNGPIATLASFPCGSLSGPPAYRVVCNWSTSGTVLSCGAAPKPLDPTSFVNLPLPSGLRPFDSVAASTFALPGATVYDNIYVWQN